MITTDHSLLAWNIRTHSFLLDTQFLGECGNKVGEGLFGGNKAGLKEGGGSGEWSNETKAANENRNEIGGLWLNCRYLGYFVHLPLKQLEKDGEDFGEGGHGLVLGPE